MALERRFLSEFERLAMATLFRQIESTSPASTRRWLELGFLGLLLIGCPSCGRAPTPPSAHRPASSADQEASAQRSTSPAAVTNNDGAAAAASSAPASLPTIQSNRQAPEV